MARRTRTSERVEVVIPWRSGCRHRELALLYVIERWRRLGFNCTIGEHDDDQWCKALAVQSAIDQTTGDVLVIADADVWCESMTDAVEAVSVGAPWSTPHYLVHRLTEDATSEVLAGVEPHPGMPLAVLPNKGPYAGRRGGGVVVVRRDVWQSCPLDRRFRGWGHEDESWGIALEHIYGPPVAYRSTLWHLWHPPQERISWGLGSEASDALYKRYHLASRNRDRNEMRALLSEGHPAIT